MSARQFKKKQTASKAVQAVLKALDEELTRLRAARDILLADTQRAVPRAVPQKTSLEAGGRRRNGHGTKPAVRAS